MTPNPFGKDESDAKVEGIYIRSTNHLEVVISAPLAWWLGQATHLREAHADCCTTREIRELVDRATAFLKQPDRVVL